MRGSASSLTRTQRYRDGLRRRGLRPVQIWVPDTRAPGFAAEIQRQCELINAADRQENLMAWVEDVSVFDEDDPA
nr:antitoxin MazE family protein [uncultured Rhodopila sp.]